VRLHATGIGPQNSASFQLRFLEMFKSTYYADASLDQWMALTPPEPVQSHLRIDR